MCLCISDFHIVVGPFFEAAAVGSVCSYHYLLAADVAHTLNIAKSLLKGS